MDLEVPMETTVAPIQKDGITMEMLEGMDPVGDDAERILAA